MLIKAVGEYEHLIDLRKDIHTSAYDIFGKEIGVEEREAPVAAGFKSKVHRRVLEKMMLYKNYKPLALMKYMQDPDTLEPYEVEE